MVASCLSACLALMVEQSHAVTTKSIGGCPDTPSRDAVTAGAGLGRVIVEPPESGLPFTASCCERALRR
jgi:hypothetical protein